MALNYTPRRIIQILSGSRSGSSLFKKVLAISPSLTSLNGEEEPYFKMSGNGYGLSSEDDSFFVVRNATLFRKLVSLEVHTSDYVDRLEHRLTIQFKGLALCGLLDALNTNLDPYNVVSWLRLRGVYGHYDGCNPLERLPFKEMNNEMPPFIIPQPYQDPTEVLLLKCPYNTYRPNIIEQIYPNTEITKIILVRNPASTINGLLDAWMCNYGFHKHLTPYGWWKFDLPPGWKEFVCRPLIERCWFQWKSTYQLLLEMSCQLIKFEDLLTRPKETTSYVCRSLGIEPTKDMILPHTMSTVPPVQFRWKHRDSQILPLLELADSQEIIRQLGYTDQSKWL